jgi:enamine deaminase RidA (YjgF/YER057c/UK114 family)
MPRKLISSGSTFEREFGYSRAVVDGEWVFVSGTTGFDYSTMTLPHGVVEQAENTFDNIEAALKKASARLADVVRVRVFVASIADFDAIKSAVIGRRLGAIRPANTTVVTGFVDSRVRVEIEATALLRRAAAPPKAKRAPVRKRKATARRRR